MKTRTLFLFAFVLLAHIVFTPSVLAQLKNNQLDIQLGKITNLSVCTSQVQGKIAWDYKGSTKWNQNNINRLCLGAETSAEPGRCFNKVLHGGINWGGGTKWKWKNAIDLCEGSINANQTISCFQGEIKKGQTWQEGIKTCSKKATSSIPAAERVALGAVQQSKTVRAIGLKNRSYVKVRKDLLRLGVVYDARGESLFFPLPNDSRRFTSSNDFAQKIQAETNGRIVGVREGKPIVLTRAVQVGSSYWVDPRTKIVYRVKDPVLATIGGKTGKIFVERREICIDPDGSCRNGLPSYLAPVVRTTSHSHFRPDCRGSGEASRCVEYHSFFNKADLEFFVWARHGANTRLISGPTSVADRLMSCPAGTPFPGANRPVPSLSVSLQTGGDNLRDESHAWMIVTLARRGDLPNPPVIGDLSRVSLNEGRELDGNTLFTSRRIALPPGVLLGHISRIMIFHESVDRWPENRDNWNMDAINIVANATATDPRYNMLGLVAPRGNYLHRFSGDEPRWSHDILPSEVAEVCFNPGSDIRLAVTSARLQRYTSLTPGARVLRTIGALPTVAETGVDSVETAAYYIGGGVELEGDMWSPATAPIDHLVFAADGICSTHSSLGFDTGSTGNGAHDCD